LLAFGLQARRFLPLCMVLLDGFHEPGITAKQFDRGWEFTASYGITDSLITHVEQGLQVLGGQKPKTN